MATVAQVAKASLQRILVQASEADLEPDEYQDYIFALNNYMLALDAEGVNLGYTLVSDLGDEVTVPLGALRGIIANVAIEVAPDYNGQITAGLQIAALAGEKVMRILGQRIPTMRFPSTLPVGAGNEGGRSRHHHHHFYPDLEAEILAETTGAIGLEVETSTAADQDTPLPPSGILSWREDNGGLFQVLFSFVDENDVSFGITGQFLDENDTGFNVA